MTPLSTAEVELLCVASSSEGRIAIMADTWTWPAPEWTRPRYFAGYTRRAIVGPNDNTPRYITFRAMFTPTHRTHGSAFDFVYGPYRTRGEARNAASIHPFPVYDARATKGGPHGR